MLCRGKCCRVGSIVSDIRNLVSDNLPGSINCLTLQFCRQSGHFEFSQLIAIGSTGNALTSYSKWSRIDIHSQILRCLLREERRVCPGVNEGEGGLACGLCPVSCDAVLEIRCAYHRGIPDPDLKAALRIFRRDGLSVCRKVYQCLCVESNLLSVGKRTVICYLKRQTCGVLHRNCVILPKRRVVGDSGLFVVGFLCPDGRIKAIVFEFFEKAGRGQLQGSAPQFICIFYVTNIVIEIAIRYTIISTICYSSKIAIILGNVNRSYTNAMINTPYISTHTTDSRRRIPSLQVSCKKALRNLT